MGVGTSIVVFAVGAILKFATNVHSSSFNIQTIGVILMVVGVVGFLLSLLFWSSWGGFGGFGGGYRRSRTVYQDPGPGYTDGYGPTGRPVVRGQRIVEQEDRGPY